MMDWIEMIAIGQEWGIWSILGTVIQYYCIYMYIILPFWSILCSVYTKVQNYRLKHPPLKVTGSNYKDDDIVSIDCEMVDVQKDGGFEKELATVAIWSAAFGKLYYEKVFHQSGSFSSNGWFSKKFGISNDSLENGKPFDVVKKEVETILADKLVIVVDGKHDFRALKIDSTKLTVFDLQDVYFTVQGNNKQPHSLMSMFYHYFGAVIFPKDDKALYDAKATMTVFKEYQKDYGHNVYENGRNDIQRLNKNYISELLGAS